MSKAKLKDDSNYNFFDIGKIVASMPEFFYWKDINGYYRGCNNSLLKIVNLKSAKDIIGKNDYELGKKLNWERSVVEKTIAVDKEIIKTGEPMFNIKEPPLKLPNGKTLWLRTSKMPLRDENGAIVGIIGVSIDFTAQKMAEDALASQIKKTAEAYHSKTEFLSTVTHEIRNPVGNVSTYNNFLQKDLKVLKEFFYKEIVSGLNLRKKDKCVAQYDKLFSKLVGSADIIGSESFKALEYLKSVGELHRLQREGVKPNFMTVKIQDFVNSVIEDTQQYNTQNIEIVISIGPKTPKVAKIDYFNISDALSVVFSNALRFSRKKGVVKLDVNADKRWLKISVQNFGEAISQEQIYGLLGDTRKKKPDPKIAIYRKPSLRLTQANMKIEASGGKLGIERMGQGTCVTLYIPFSLDGIDSVAKNQETENNEVPFAKRKVLIIEDDLNFQKTEKRIVKELGHVATFASTGADALKLLSKNTYDVVLLDITLPDMSGIQVLEKIRKTKKSLPVVVITSHAHKKDILLFETLGATLVLTKPLSREDFKECLEFDFAADDDDD